MPSRQVSRKALTCSGSRVMWATLPSLTSLLVVDHWKLELNRIPLGRVNVDALHLALKTFSARQGCHYLQAVAQDHPVGPVLVVFVVIALEVLILQPV